jgi:SRSO17 transposase
MKTIALKVNIPTAGDTHNVQYNAWMDAQFIANPTPEGQIETDAQHERRILRGIATLAIRLQFRSWKLQADRIVSESNEAFETVVTDGGE